jgi:hypothetical protein
MCRILVLQAIRPRSCTSDTIASICIDSLNHAARGRWPAQRSALRFLYCTCPRSRFLLATPLGTKATCISPPSIAAVLLALRAVGCKTRAPPCGFGQARREPTSQGGAGNFVLGMSASPDRGHDGEPYRVNERWRTDRNPEMPFRIAVIGYRADWSERPQSVQV